VMFAKFHVTQNEVKAGDQVREAESRAEGSVRVDSLDIAQKPGELDCKGSPEVGVDGPEKVFDGRG
jgi:hypothetical protein